MLFCNNATLAKEFIPNQYLQNRRHRLGLSGFNLNIFQCIYKNDEVSPCIPSQVPRRERHVCVVLCKLITSIRCTFCGESSIIIDTENVSDKT